eukprot:TRINITY_DN4989_c0_g1_i1.p1 TRINITY_DN4989_c0_g1~~TRINITY_DN4989_c0_g1_i1.p1  ORF type:complete len:280 (+),score=35.44 TRINITY_DN4989_c0_g1_i1:167-1006(+)
MVRVITYAPDIVNQIRPLYASAHASTIVTLLAQKIARVRLDSSVRDARQLLEDWFSILLLKYSQNLAKQNAHTVTEMINFQFDNNSLFSDHQNLSNLPTKVFSLLKSDLLQEYTFPFILSPSCSFMSQSPKYANFSDYWSFLHCLINNISTEAFDRALYPVCSGFKTQYDKNPVYLELSKQALTSSACNFFLFDKYYYFIVYYPNMPDDNTWSPSPNSSIVEIKETLMKGRPVKAPLIVLGSENAQLLYELLLEEDNTRGIGYTKFIQFIKQLTTSLNK